MVFFYSESKSSGDYIRLQFNVESEDFWCYFNVAKPKCCPVVVTL